MPTAASVPVPSRLAEEYDAVLREYLDGAGDAALKRAFQIGRRALAEDRSASALARVHHEALMRALGAAAMPEKCVRVFEAAARLFLESMTPLEMARREADRALRRVNARLEEEARRIAHALHDEAGQLLASVYLAVAEISREAPPSTRVRLERVSVLLDQIVEQLRHLSHELRPVLLDDAGLVPALEFLADGVSKRSGLSVAIEVSMDSRLPPSIETAVYRILQETLNNVTRHAHACRVEVRLQKTGRTIRYSIKDDGIGFDSPAGGTNRAKIGLGLIGIRERLAELGGTLSIVSGAGEGTTLEMVIPLDASLAVVAAPELS